MESKESPRLQTETLGVSKKIFDYPNLSMNEVRILMAMTGKQKLNMNKLKVADKKVIIKGNDNLNRIDEYMESLIEKTLISNDGKVTLLSKKGESYLTFNGLDEIKNIKTLRQLFIYSLQPMKWNPKHDKAWVSYDTFYGMMGTNKWHLITNLIKRIEIGMGFDINIEDDDTKFVIDVKKSSDSPKNVSDNQSTTLSSKVVEEPIKSNSELTTMIEDTQPSKMLSADELANVLLG